MNEITVGGKKFYFLKPTIQFAKSAQVYATSIEKAWTELFSDEGDIEKFNALWEKFCNDVFERGIVWRLRWKFFGKLPKQLRVSNMEFSAKKIEVREIISFFFVLFGEILKGLAGQSKPSSGSDQVVTKE